MLSGYRHFDSYLSDCVYSDDEKASYIYVAFVSELC
jgi:hypothetical protein